jgi:hypothetical protein
VDILREHPDVQGRQRTHPKLAQFFFTVSSRPAVGRRLRRRLGRRLRAFGPLVTFEGIAPDSEG